MRPSFVPEVGTWVRSQDSGGICQVQRVIQVHDVYQCRFSLADRKKKGRDGMVLARRLLTKSWAVSIGNEQLSLWMVEALVPQEEARLRRYLAENPRVVEEFREAHEPFGLLLNLTVELPDGITVEQISAMFADIAAVGLTCDEILSRIEGSTLGIKVTPIFYKATLQFYCQDCEIRDREYVFRRLRVDLAGG